MTPLVGRVPFRGRLRDPFRFKLITGATNLASNGHHIPGIANAVWTGYVVGVREQSCARAYIDTVTFTFEDGRIHTVHKGKGNTRKEDAYVWMVEHYPDLPWLPPDKGGMDQSDAAIQALAYDALLQRKDEMAAEKKAARKRKAAAK
jgi:integrating conjugative element protein (TIGR03752 family)